MSKHAERCLLQHLTDGDSLAIIVEEGLDPEVLPTPEFRDVLTWTIRYYFESNCVQAPSLKAFEEEWTLDFFQDRDVDLDDAPDDTIEWAIENLKGSYTQLLGQRFVKEFAVDLNEAQTDEKVEVFSAAADVLLSTIHSLARKNVQADLREGITDRLRAYEDRKARGESISGLTLGLPTVDQHTSGIHPGELAVLAAPPKVGKSYMLAYAALKQWEAGRVACLFTLENSVEMTLDRIACLATGVDPRAWLHGTCHETEEKSVYAFQERLAESDVPLWILQPERDRRTMEHLVREASIRDADSLLIDQLTFVHAPERQRRRDLEIRDMMHDLKELISTARRRMPCLLAHQINREGVQMARKTGHLLMDHMAEGAEVERTADFVFGLYQTDDDKVSHFSKFQMLAARRTDLRHWELDWHVAQGLIRVRRSIELQLAA